MAAQAVRCFCHLGSGISHRGTARVYTGCGLFTSDEAVGNDVHEIFLQLTSLTQTPRLRRLLQAPFKLQEALHALIDRERNDEVDITQLLAAYLGNHGFRVSQVHSGKALMELMARDAR